MGAERRPCFVGFDTSNYTTSVAACALGDGGRVRILANLREPLPVRQGERGLRQSDAVFAHVRNLPALAERLQGILADGGYAAAAVGYSARPRDGADSYMPCFLAGQAAAAAYAAGAGAPAYPFSHQCGHIAAALHSSGAPVEGARRPFLSFHVSGGTTDALLATPLEGVLSVERAGGSADLHAGQLIDRVGVRMGLPFPCGPAMERLASANAAPLPRLKTCVRDGTCHLSGVENLAVALWEGTRDAPLVAAFVLASVARTLRLMTEQIQASLSGGSGAPPLPVLYAGGVMGNRLIRPALTDGAPWDAYFAEPDFSSDNAAGVAILCAYAHGRGVRPAP